VEQTVAAIAFPRREVRLFQAEARCYLLNRYDVQTFVASDSTNKKNVGLSNENKLFHLISLNWHLSHKWTSVDQSRVLQSVAEMLFVLNYNAAFMRY
jgi:hypothetical protein